MGKTTTLLEFRIKNAQTAWRDAKHVEEYLNTIDADSWKVIVADFPEQYGITTKESYIDFLRKISVIK